MNEGWDAKEVQVAEEGCDTIYRNSSPTESESYFCVIFGEVVKFIGSNLSTPHI